MSSSFHRNLLLLVAIIITLIAAATSTRVKQQEQEYWFTQKLDHYNAQDTRTFQQRYFVFNHQPESSTVLLYICGEGPCPSTPFNYVRNYAQQLGATLYTVEHRYYGKSIPQLFSDLSTPNLKYLSSQQALADLAHFIQTTNNKNNKNNKKQYHWISVGCSYPGALSAWLRYKYPHLIMGALSSSGVVNTIVDFPQFDHRVYLSSGVKCGSVLRRVTLAMERQMLPPYNQGQLIKQLFRWKDMNKSNDTLLNNGDFFFLMADAAAESIQYGFHEELCSVMEPWYTKYVDIVDDIKLIESFAQFVTSSYYVNFGEDSPLEYTTYFASQTSLANSDASVRQWNYQVCSEFGYLQNMPLNSSVAIRSHFINNAYQMHKCNVMFQNQLPSTQILFPTQPVAKKTFDQMYYGGKELRTHKKRVIYANGSQDPWLEASVSSEHDGFLMVHCENCGHCVDLRGCPSLPNGDSGVNEKCMGNGNQLAQQARSIILQQFKQWIQEEEQQ